MVKVAEVVEEEEEEEVEVVVGVVDGSVPDLHHQGHIHLQDHHLPQDHGFLLADQGHPLGPVVPKLGDIIIINLTIVYHTGKEREHTIQLQHTTSKMKKNFFRYFIKII